MKTLLNTYKKRIIIILTLALIANIATIRIFDAPLKNQDCPNGITSFELAKDLSKTVEILNAWDDNAKINMSLSLGFDFLFLVIYSSYIALLIFFTNQRFQKNKFYYNFGKVLIFMIFFAALFDIIENIALINLLQGNLEQIWSSISYYFATIKFAIVLLCISYLLINSMFFLILKRSPSGHL